MGNNTMKKMHIYEPVMCCPTGICGPNIDPGLMCISMILDTLEKMGLTVDRFNLTNAPKEFMKNLKLYKKEGLVWNIFIFGKVECGYSRQLD